MELSSGTRPGKYINKDTKMGQHITPYVQNHSPVSRGIGTATAGAALAAPLFSMKKKKVWEGSGETRIGKLNNFLVNITQLIL